MTNEKRFTNSELKAWFNIKNTLKIKESIKTEALARLKEYWWCRVYFRTYFMKTEKQIALDIAKKKYEIEKLEIPEYQEFILKDGITYQEIQEDKEVKEILNNFSKKGVFLDSN